MEGAKTMAGPSLGLIVLRARSMEASLAFYRALGLAFVEERHGSGPVHYSCQVGATVIEIYPGTPGQSLDHRSGGAIMLGFNVVSLTATLAAVEQTEARLLSSPKTTSWGSRAVVEDPDGRAIEINEPNPGR